VRGVSFVVGLIPRGESEKITRFLKKKTFKVVKIRFFEEIQNWDNFLVVWEKKTFLFSNCFFLIFTMYRLVDIILYFQITEEAALAEAELHTMEEDVLINEAGRSVSFMVSPSALETSKRTPAESKKAIARPVAGSRITRSSKRGSSRRKTVTYYLF
jgi:hypothetical protein